MASHSFGSDFNGLATDFRDPERINLRPRRDLTETPQCFLFLLL